MSLLTWFLPLVRLRQPFYCLENLAQLLLWLFAWISLFCTIFLTCSVVLRVLLTEQVILEGNCRCLLQPCWTRSSSNKATETLRFVANSFFSLDNVMNSCCLFLSCCKALWHNTWTLTSNPRFKPSASRNALTVSSVQNETLWFVCFWIRVRETHLCIAWLCTGTVADSCTPTVVVPPEEKKGGSNVRSLGAELVQFDWKFQCSYSPYL